MGSWHTLTSSPSLSFSVTGLRAPQSLGPTHQSLTCWSYSLTSVFLCPSTCRSMRCSSDLLSPFSCRRFTSTRGGWPSFPLVSRGRFLAFLDLSLALAGCCS